MCYNTDKSFVEEMLNQMARVIQDYVGFSTLGCAL